MKTFGLKSESHRSYLLSESNFKLVIVQVSRIEDAYQSHINITSSVTLHVTKNGNINDSLFSLFFFYLFFYSQVN